MKSAKFPPCVACNEPLVVSYAMRAYECKHIAHSWCFQQQKKCPACVVAPPAPPKSSWTWWILSATWYGIMGEAHARNGEYRRSVMMATTLGFLWSTQPFVALVRLLFKRDLETPVFFMLFVWLYSKWLGSTLASCVALWIAGEYGIATWPYAAGYAVDILICTAFTYLFQIWDVTGSLAVFVVTFRAIWRWPSMWDIHAGNCCGAGSVLAGVFLAALMGACAASGLVHETFDAVRPMHAWIVARSLFNRQTEDPFTE